MRFDGPAVEIGEISEVSDGDFVVETCIVRSLPPAVTLEQGIESIREAVEALKLDPPCSSSGFLRFQVGFGDNFLSFSVEKRWSLLRECEMECDFFSEGGCASERESFELVLLAAGAVFRVSSIFHFEGDGRAELQIAASERNSRSFRYRRCCLL